MLANLCQHTAVSAFIASCLPGQKLDLLVEAVGEFVTQQQRVDRSFEGKEGMEVWETLTEQLKAVLARLMDVAGIS